MAITLTSQTVPTSPTTPRSAAQVIFDNNYAILSKLPLRQRLAIALVGGIHAASGTVDYRSNHNQLRQDAMVFLGGLSTPLDFWSVVASMGWTAGKAQDGTLTADVSALMTTEAKEFLDQSDEALIRQLLFVMLI